MQEPTMTTAHEALRKARDHISRLRDDDLTSFTLNGDLATLEADAAPFIAEHDQALAEIDAALAGEPAPIGWRAVT